ncbi:hypothetical protein GJ698_07095 [Pseudoduganella sp. FT26W]|uniref:DUF3108 domain-containing protein n=1 Tax=Duganella aquatilis TaxID=2666082 RepID=A0A844CYP3_9BURK|nr:hypothetical protein [Duganella aquatilis]MRW83861.1 hypothetical protein [Duganella aquatilis]
MLQHFTKLKSVMLGMMFFCGLAYGVELQEFSPNDEWTFLQLRTEPGKPDVSNEIRLSMLFKKKSGDMMLGWAKAITASGQVIWQPIESLPATNCLRDFVGRTNLDLVNSCKEGLKVGSEWKSEIKAGDVLEQIDFIVVGEEVINSKAGTFQAIKIQGKGKRTYQGINLEKFSVTYWFAPKAKAMVQSVREYRTLDGAPIIKISNELISVNVN